MAETFTIVNDGTDRESWLMARRPGVTATDVARLARGAPARGPLCALKKRAAVATSRTQPCNTEPTANRSSPNTLTAQFWNRGYICDNTDCQVSSIGIIWAGLVATPTEIKKWRKLHVGRSGLPIEELV